MNPSAVSAILREGTVISTKLGTGGAWYRNIIYKSENHTVLVSLLDKYLENEVSAGANLSLKFSNEYFIYLFEGKISRIITTYPQHLAVLVHRAEEIINTRMHARYDANLAANIKPVWDSTFHFSIATNISMGGMAFNSAYKFDNNEETEGYIHLPENTELFLRGRIIRSSSKSHIHEYSMQFTDMAPSARERLGKYLALLDEENDRLQRYFFEVVKEDLKKAALASS